MSSFAELGESLLVKTKEQFNLCGEADTIKFDIV